MSIISKFSSDCIEFDFLRELLPSNLPPFSMLKLPEQISPNTNPPLKISTESASTLPSKIPFTTILLADIIPVTLPFLPITFILFFFILPFTSPSIYKT